MESEPTLNHKVRVTRAGDLARIDFADGEIVGDGYADQLRVAVDQIVLQMPGGQVVLNLSDVDYLSSAILGEIVRAHRCIDDAGGRLHISKPRPSVMDIFEITRLSNMLNILASPAAPLD